MTYIIELKRTGIGGHIIYTNDSIQVTIPMEAAGDYRKGMEVNFKSMSTDLPIDEHRKLINEIKNNLKEWATEHDATFSW